MDDPTSTDFTLPGLVELRKPKQVPESSHHGSHKSTVFNSMRSRLIHAQWQSDQEQQYRISHEDAALGALARLPLEVRCQIYRTCYPAECTKPDQIWKSRSNLTSLMRTTRCIYNEIKPLLDRYAQARVFNLVLSDNYVRFESKQLSVGFLTLQKLKDMTSETYLPLGVFARTLPRIRSLRLAVQLDPVIPPAGLVAALQPFAMWVFSLIARAETLRLLVVEFHANFTMNTETLMKLESSDMSIGLLIGILLGTKAATHCQNILKQALTSELQAMRCVVYQRSNDPGDPQTIIKSWRWNRPTRLSRSPEAIDRVNQSLLRETTPPSTGNVASRTSPVYSPPSLEVGPSEPSKDFACPVESVEPRERLEYFPKPKVGVTGLSNDSALPVDPTEPCEPPKHPPAPAPTVEPDLTFNCASQMASESPVWVAPDAISEGDETGDIPAGTTPPMGALLRSTSSSSLDPLIDNVKTQAEENANTNTNDSDELKYSKSISENKKRKRKSTWETSYRKKRAQRKQEKHAQKRHSSSRPLRPFDSKSRSASIEVLTPAEDEEYVVKRLIEEKIEDGVTYMKVKWQGYQEMTWEPRSQLKQDVPSLVRAFDRMRQGPVETAEAIFNASQRPFRLRSITTPVKPKANLGTTSSSRNMHSKQALTTPIKPNANARTTSLLWKPAQMPTVMAPRNTPTSAFNTSISPSKKIKKPLTAMALYTQANRGTIAADLCVKLGHPELVNEATVTTEGARCWFALGADQRRIWERLQAKRVAAYHIQMEAFRAGKLVPSQEEARKLAEARSERASFMDLT